MPLRACGKCKGHILASVAMIGMMRIGECVLTAYVDRVKPGACRDEGIHAGIGDLLEARDIDFDQVLSELAKSIHGSVAELDAPSEVKVGYLRRMRDEPEDRRVRQTRAMAHVEEAQVPQLEYRRQNEWR